MTFLLLPEDESGFRAFNVNCNRSGITTYNRALLCSSNSVTRLCFQYLAISNIEICPKAYKMCKRELKTLPKTN